MAGSVWAGRIPRSCPNHQGWGDSGGEESWVAPLLTAEPTGASSVGTLIPGRLSDDQEPMLFLYIRYPMVGQGLINGAGA